MKEMKLKKTSVKQRKILKSNFVAFQFVNVTLFCLKDKDNVLVQKKLREEKIFTKH